jgi:hypothetical protein
MFMRSLIARCSLRQVGDKPDDLCQGVILLRNAVAVRVTVGARWSRSIRQSFSAFWINRARPY